MNSAVCKPRIVIFSLALAIAIFLPLRSTSSAAPNAQGTSCLTAPVAADPSATVCISQIVVQVNARSEKNSFYVSWRTTESEKGQVRIVDGKTFEDVRGADFEGKTHYVRVDGLRAKAEVPFDIVSGGTTYTNGGSHWVAELGEAVEESSPYFIIGHVTNPNGSGADGALVYAQIRDGDNQGTEGRTALLSALIVVPDGGDLFNINLGFARKQNNLQPYEFNPQADRVFITALGADGTVSEQFIIQDLHPPRPPPSLMLSQTGTGTVATATPTLIPDTATPTATPTLTETPTLTPTETALAPTATRPPLPTDTPAAPPTVPNSISPSAELSPTAETTIVAMPADNRAEPQRTRVFGGVPNIQPPPPPANNTILFIVLAVVLFVGALLLGLAAFFASRR